MLLEAAFGPLVCACAAESPRAVRVTAPPAAASRTLRRSTSCAVTARFLLGLARALSYSARRYSPRKLQLLLCQSGDGRRRRIRDGEDRADIDLAQHVCVLTRRGARAVEEVSVP